MNEVLLKEETTTKTPIVDVESLVVDFTSRNQLFSKQMIRAVNEVSFQLFRGEALAVVGESGSGKSTCARTLCKLNKHTGGVIRFDQREIEEFDTPEERLQYAARMQMIFQDPFGSLNPVHTVEHHLMRPLKLHQSSLSVSELKDKIEALLNQVGLTP
ncbi:MAG: ATP-binding cassette domain-containing protein, partial [bacterium]